MSGNEHLIKTLRSQGRACAALGSPMYGELLERVIADVQAGDVFAVIFAGHEDDPGRLAVPLRLLGGLHRLVLDGRAPTLRRFYPSTGGSWDADAAWPHITLAAANQIGPLRAALDQPPQTNEVGRSAALIGGLLILAHRFRLPVRLFEIGSSAGLNLRADYFHYRYSGGHWGPPNSPVTVNQAWQGHLPTATDLRILQRAGYDIAPLDATRPEGEIALLSYVWPDMTERLDRLRGAIEIARQVPAQVERRTAVDAVADLRVADGALTVLWHSITWQYLSAGEQAGVRAGIDAIAAQSDTRAPFAHLMLEPQRRSPAAPVAFLLRVRSWPDGADQILAECSPHGPPVAWA